MAIFQKIYQYFQMIFFTFPTNFVKNKLSVFVYDLDLTKYHFPVEKILEKSEPKVGSDLGHPNRPSGHIKDDFFSIFFHMYFLVSIFNGNIQKIKITIYRTIRKNIYIKHF